MCGLTNLCLKCLVAFSCTISRNLLESGNTSAVSRWINPINIIPFFTQTGIIALEQAYINTGEKHIKLAAAKHAMESVQRPQTCIDCGCCMKQTMGVQLLLLLRLTPRHGDVYTSQQLAPAAAAAAVQVSMNDQLAATGGERSGRGRGSRYNMHPPAIDAKATYRLASASAPIDTVIDWKPRSREVHDTVVLQPVGLSSNRSTARPSVPTRFRPSRFPISTPLPTRCPFSFDSSRRESRRHRA